MIEFLQNMAQDSDTPAYLSHPGTMIMRSASDRIRSSYMHAFIIGLSIEEMDEDLARPASSWPRKGKPAVVPAIQAPNRQIHRLHPTQAQLFTQSPTSFP